MTEAEKIAAGRREVARQMIAGAMSSTALTNPMMGCLMVLPAHLQENTDA